MELTPCNKVQWCLSGGTVVHASEPVRGKVTELKELSMCRVGATLTCSQGWLSVELRFVLQHDLIVEMRRGCFFFLWSNDGDIQRSNKEKILVTHRAVRVQQDTWTIYSVSILIWLFIKLSFSYQRKPNTACHLVTMGPDGYRILDIPKKIWWINWSFFFKHILKIQYWPGTQKPKTWWKFSRAFSHISSSSSVYGVCSVLI